MHIKFKHVHVDTTGTTKKDLAVFDVLLNNLPRHNNGFDINWNVSATRKYINAHSIYPLSDTDKLLLTIKFPRENTRDFFFKFGDNKSRQMVKANYLLHMLYDKLSDVYKNLP